MNRSNLAALVLAACALLAVALAKLGRTDDAGIVCENLTDMALVDKENGT